MNTQKQIRGKNVLLLIFSLAVFFLFLEFALMLGGYVYLMFHRPFEVTKKNSDGFTIVCLGDSFTFGMGTDYPNSYPRQLERILLEKYPKNNFYVYNLASLGSNSSYWLEQHHLEDILIKYEPQAVLLMVGLNNEWNMPKSYLLFGKNKFLFYKLSRQIDILLSRLRLYKMFKIIVLSLQKKTLQLTEQRVKNKGTYKKEKVLEISDVLKVDPVSNEHMLLGFNLMVSAAANKQEAYASAEKELKLAIEIDPNNFFAYVHLAFMYQQRARYILAEKYFKSALAITEKIKIPNDFSFQIHKGLAEVYTEIGSFKDAREQIELCLQNLISVIPQNVGEIVMRVRQITESDDDFLSEINSIKKVISALAISKKEKKEIYKIIDDNIYFLKGKEIRDTVLKYDLMQIVGKLKEKKVKVVLLTYPCYVSSAFFEIADKYRIPLVDNFASFEEKLKKLKREDLLVRDGHCNANGYKILAENIYNKLLQEGIIDNYINGQISN